MKRKKASSNAETNTGEKREIEKAKGEHPEIVDILDLLMKLTELSGDTVSIEGSSISWDKLEEGLPVIDKRILPKNLDSLMKRFKRIMEILMTGNGRAASAVIETFEKGKSFKKLLEGVLIGHYDFPEDFPHSRPVTLLAAGETILPLINGIKKSDSLKEKLNNWNEPYCPICGAPPNISAIEGEENRLYLYCGRCAQRWNFPRLVCVHCGEEDQKKLRYFFAENDEVHRVYVCDSCKHYIKSVDNREKTVFFPQLEDVTTMGLDIVAKREGYIRETIDLVGLVLIDYDAKKAV